jgi:hypothetical protein
LTLFKEEAGLCLKTAALLGEISCLEGDGLGEMKSVSGMRTLGEGNERAGAVEVGSWFGVGRAWAGGLLMVTNLGNGGRSVLGAETADDGRLTFRDLFLAEREG